MPKQRLSPYPPGPRAGGRPRVTGGGVVYGGSVLAAVVAGAVALFAPCCISVMLPAYFVSSFHN